MALGPADRIASTQSSTAAFRSSGATKRSTRPQAAASSASMCLPVNTSSRVLPQPISCGSRQASMPDGRPNSTSGMPNFAVSTAARMSQAAAISRPAPKQYPFTRAITGTGARRIASHTRCVRDGPSDASCCTKVDISLMFAPPMKDRSPAPVSTTTRKRGSVETRSNASASSRLPPLPSALRCSALLTVMRATVPASPRSSIVTRMMLISPAAAAPRRGSTACGHCRNTCRRHPRRWWESRIRRDRSVPACCCAACP